MSEKVKVKITRNVSVLPAIALRGLVVFPNNIVHFEVGRAKSIAAIEAAMHANSSVFLVAQKEMDVEEPTMLDLYGYGVIAEIKQVLRVSDDLVKVLVEGKSRARLLELDAIADAYEDFVEANGLDLETLEPFTIDFYESGESFAEEYADLWASYPFDDFDQAYLQHWEKLDLEGKMLDFAAAHPEAFGP